MNVYLFLIGYTELRVPAAAMTDFFEICRVLGISPRGAKRRRNSEDVICRLSRFSAARVMALATQREIALTVLKTGGLPALWLRFIHRPGIVFGALTALALLVAANLFVWDVDITGCEVLTEREVEEELKAVGLSRGVFLPLVDGDAIMLALRQSDSRIAYATVNLIGTVAHVQIREAEPEPTKVPHAPANLVAKQDGIVVLPLIFEGECLVEVGEYVRAGQVLASGILDSESGGFRVTRAAGRVLARTEETIAVSVPFCYNEKVLTGRVFREVEVSFFGMRGKVFKNTGNVTNSCDIIVYEKEFYAGAHTLPFGLTVAEYYEYTEQAARRTATEALSLANEELAARLATASEARTLLAKTVEVVVDEEGVTLFCTAAFEEDIATVFEFSVSP
ncbi:MAG: sporulation protein YqfD [Clostridia bacterium]|nr:sporulation protein YqfD [Clostridia bacterium]